MDTSVVLGTIITCLLLATGHWFPWDFYLGSGLPRIATYIYGSAAVLVGYAIGWGLPAAVELGLLYLAAGSTVCLCYATDSFAKKRAARRRSSSATQRSQGQ